MAEATKKSPQTTGSTEGRSKGTPTGATDPTPERANLGGSPSGVTASGTDTRGTVNPASRQGQAGQGSGGGATAGYTPNTGADAGTSSSSRTSGVHDTASASAGKDLANPSRFGEGGDAHGLIDQMKTSASETLRTVKSNTAAKLEEQKSTLSSGLLTVADNISQLGDNLSGGEQRDAFTRIAADYSETAATKLRSAADYFNSHDLETMYRDIEGMARRNPAVFVGGAFAIGFLAARFLKSSTPRDADRGPSGSMTAGRFTNVPKLNSGGTTSRPAVG